MTPGTAKSFPGPATVTNDVPLDEMPIWIKSGAVLPLAPEMQYTGEKPWDPVTLDCYPCAGKTNSATLYEDDTLTTAYQRGEFRNTPITVAADETAKTVQCGNWRGERKLSGCAGQPGLDLADSSAGGLAEKPGTSHHQRQDKSTSQSDGSNGMRPRCRWAIRPARRTGMFSKSACRQRRFPKASRWKSRLAPKLRQQLHAVKALRHPSAARR